MGHHTTDEAKTPEQIASTIKMTLGELTRVKLADLLAAFGYRDDVQGFLTDYGLENVVPGICMKPSCDYTTETEPDAWGNQCEVCGLATVRSGLVLAGAI